MAFWVDDTSSQTPSLLCKMNWYRFWTVKSKLHHRVTSRAESGEESCSAGPQPDRARIRGGAPPTCRKRQYTDRGRRGRRKNGAKSCSDAAARPGRS
eukprot:152048-Prymnesium_polylepis.1